jgi:hypothetical protein
MQHLEVIAVMRTENFKKKLSDNNAVLEPVILNNHHALRTIDNFAILFTRNSKLAEKNTAPNKEACPPRPAPPPARYWGSYGEKNHRRRRSWKGQYQLRCWRTPSRVTSTAGGGVSPAACAGVRGGRRPGRYIPRFKPSTSSNCPEGRHKATLSRG